MFPPAPVLTPNTAAASLVAQRNVLLLSIRLSVIKQRSPILVEPRPVALILVETSTWVSTRGLALRGQQPLSGVWKEIPPMVFNRRDHGCKGSWVLRFVVSFVSCLIRAVKSCGVALAHRESKKRALESRLHWPPATSSSSAPLSRAWDLVHWKEKPFGCSEPFLYNGMSGGASTWVSPSSHLVPEPTSSVVTYQGRQSSVIMIHNCL